MSYLIKRFVEKCSLYHKFYIMLSSYFNNSQSDTTLSNKTLEKNKLFKKFFQKLRKIFNKNTVKIYFFISNKSKII